MKFDIVKTMIAIAVSCLVAYGCYTFNTGDHKELLTVGSLIFLIPTLILTIGIQFNLPRTNSLIKTVSGVFFGLAVVCNLTFSLVSFKEPSLYIIVCGVLFLVYLLIAYSISRAHQ